MIFRDAVPLAARLSALIFIIAAIHPAEAQVCANWVALSHGNPACAHYLFLVHEFIAPVAHDKFRKFEELGSLV